jgi:uncharacterized protein with FMN-binding domain
MKKIVTSVVFIALFATYALYLHANTPTGASSATQTATAATTQTVAQTDTSNTNSNSSNSSQTASLAAATPAEAPKGQYKDGIYTGSSANAFYGNVQVKVTVAGGKIADVAFLSYPNDRRQSQEINSYAMPQLKQEALAAQSAQVDGVSGATDTSDAFVQSLSSALASAKA